MPDAPPSTRARRTWPQRLLIAGLAVGTVLPVGAAAVVVDRYGLLDEIVRLGADEAPVDVVEDPGRPENFLIVGSDSRSAVDPDNPEDDPADSNVVGQRSDTIMLVRVDPTTTAVQIVSFPRDLWVPIAGTTRHDRINAAFAEGRDVLIETIRDYFEVEINNYVEVDFAGFERLVNAIGGIPIYLDHAYRDTHSSLSEIGPGCAVLQGDSALAFARSRYLQYKLDSGRWSSPDPTADLGRITRQQLLVRLALAQVQRLNPVADILTYNRLLEVLVDSVTISESLTNDELRGLADRFQGFDAEDMENFALPVTPFTTDGGAEVLELQEREAQRVLNVFRGVDPDTVFPEDVTVAVYNGSGVPHQAADVATALEVVGFDTEVIGDAEPTTVTTVTYPPGYERAAQILVRHLSSRAQMVEDPDLEPFELGLVTGADFTTVTRSPWPESAVPLPTPTTDPDDTSGTSTTVPELPTTTVAGMLPEQPPAGVAC